MRIAITNGLTVDELVDVVEVVTHLAFYTGWPGAMTAISVAKQLFASEG